MNKRTISKLKSYINLHGYRAPGAKLIGVGTARFVYEFENFPGVVVKVADDGDQEQNEREWNIAQDPLVKDILPKVFDHTPGFTGLFVEKVKVLSLEDRQIISQALSLPEDNHLIFFENLSNAIKNPKTDIQSKIQRLVEIHDVSLTEIREGNVGITSDGRFVIIDWAS